MNKFFILFIVFFVLTLLINHINIRENYGVDWDAKYLKHKGRCFDCEKQMIDMYGQNAAWIGQQAKSFDSEREALLHGNTGFLAKTIKYY